MIFDRRVRDALEVARREGRKGKDLGDRVQQLLEIDKLDVNNAMHIRMIREIAESYNRIVTATATKPVAKKTGQGNLFV